MKNSLERSNQVKKAPNKLTKVAPVAAALATLAAPSIAKAQQETSQGISRLGLLWEANLHLDMSGLELTFGGEFGQRFDTQGRYERAPHAGLSFGLEIPFGSHLALGPLWHGEFGPGGVLQNSFGPQINILLAPDALDVQLHGELTVGTDENDSLKVRQSRASLLGIGDNWYAGVGFTQNAEPDGSKVCFGPRGGPLIGEFGAIDLGVELCSSASHIGRSVDEVRAALRFNFTAAMGKKDRKIRRPQRIH